MNVSIVPAELWHVLEIAPYVRECDRDEIWAATHLSVGDALRQAIQPTYGEAEMTESNSAYVGNWIVAIFGVVCTSTKGREGMPWLIGTDGLTAHPITFKKMARDWLKEVRERYQWLHNFVDARNTASVRWLKSLDFDVHPPQPHGPDGMPFHFFEWRAA